MPAPRAEVGDWYRYTTGDLFEVVAVDDDDETIEVQHFDGTIEEIDFESWESQWADKTFEAAEAPEDWSGSVDVESIDDSTTMGSDYANEEGGLRASSLDGIDLFD